jgi:membrane protease YdiL (CAAX protease family)
MSAHSLDRRSTLLLAIFPSLAIGLLNQFYLELVYRQGHVWYFLADAGQWVVTPILVWLFVLRPAWIKPKDFGLRLPILGDRPFESVVLFLLVSVLLWFTYGTVRDISYYIFWPYAGTFGYEDAIPKSFPWNILVVTYYALTAAFVEEVVFRGLPWAYFSIAVPQPRRKFWYVTVTSILFAATHSEQGPHGMIAALSFGIVAAMLYTHLKDLWPLVFGHFFVDLISFWPK